MGQLSELTNQGPGVTGVTGKRISDLRTQRGWSQKDLAARIAQESPTPISRSTIAKLESGVRATLRVEEAEALARAFGLSLAAFTGTGPLIFISYAQADLGWAQWIDHQLESAGYRTVMQDKHFVAGVDFVRMMDDGLRQAELVLCVLSREYLRSKAGSREWQAVYASRLGRDDRSGLLPVRIEDCPVEGLLASLTYVDLAGVTDHDAACTMLLARIAESRAGRAAPSLPPQYPGSRFGPPLGSIPAQAVEPEYPPELTRHLLVQEIVKTRHPGARVFQYPGAFPHLLVSFSHGGTVEQARIGTHVGEVTEEVLDQFASHVRDADPQTPAELVYQGRPPSEAVEAEAARRGVRLRSIDDFRGLVDLRPFVERQTDRLEADHEYAPRHYVPQRFRDLSASATKVDGDLADHLVSRLRRDEGGFVLLLGEFGAGKTFALREVARRLAGLPDLIPLYIELRTLDKAHSVEGLVSSHLANHQHRQIDLDAFQNLLRAGRIVLLFDGFDELVTRITYDRAADHLRRLMAAAESRAKIVVASRTQHFKSSEQILTALGEQVGRGAQRRMLAIEPFDADQIRSYLTRHYDEDATRAQDRIDAMRRINDLTALSANPRMLAFIAALDDAQLKAAAIAPVLSGATLYEQVLDHWLAYEVERTSGITGAPPGLTRAQLWRAVSVLALRLWESGQSHLSMEELGEVGTALAQVAGFRLSPEQTVHAVGAGSLLIRSEDDQFGFIHTSVTEWLLAKRIADDWASGVPEPTLLVGQALPDTVLEFLCDLAGAGNALDWVNRVLADPDAESARRTNAVHLSSRLRVGTGADLRGANLHGENLSAMKLRSARFGGANLEDCLLVGTDLTGADLRGAQLRGARLNDADLTAADLSGADLSWARLIGTTLTGAKLEKADWHRAALIDVQGLDRLDEAQREQLMPAAIAPGDKVEVAVGVSRTAVHYGFSVGQLPRPASFNSQGDLLAVGTAEGAVLLYDVRTGQPVRTLQGHSGPAYLVRFGGAGHPTLYTGGADGTVRTWDPETGRGRTVMGGHQNWVWPVVPNREGTVLLAGDSSGTVRLWDPDAGTVTWELPGHTERVWTAEFHRETGIVAVGDQSGTIHMWDPGTGELVHHLRPADPGGSVYRVYYSIDGTRLASAHEEGAVRLWDVETGRLLTELTDHTGRVYSLHFDRSGRYMATGDTDGNVFIWDLTTDPPRRTELHGHRGAVYRVAFDLEGNALITADSDGVVQLFDFPSGVLRQRIQAHSGSVWPFVFHPRGNRFATSSSDGETKVWNSQTGDLIHRVRGHGRTMVSARFNQDGSLLAACGYDGAVRLWDPRYGRQVRVLRWREPLTDALFTPQFPVLATVGASGWVHLWEETGEYLRELYVETKRVWAIGFSPDGDILATANDDNSVKLWYRTTGRLIHTLSEHAGRVRSLDFSADGRTVVTGCEDGRVRMWDVGTGRLLDVSGLHEHSRRVYSVDWAINNEFVASAGLDGDVQLWDPGTQISTLIPGAAGGKAIRASALHPDGTAVAVSGVDTDIHLWEVGADRAPHLAATLRGHTGVVNRLSFSRDGSLLASAADDGNVRLWNITSDPRLQQHQAAARSTLIGLPAGWAAVAPDGRYKTGGDIAGELWHLVGMCRFELGELDGYLDEVRQAAQTEEL